MKRRDTFLWAMAGLCLVIAGCNGHDFGPTGTVAGTLLRDGEPLRSGTVVVFMQVDQGYAGYGETDAQGNFRILSFNDGNMPVGRYQVMLQPVTLGPDPESATPEDLLDRPEMFQAVEATEEFDFKYRQTSTSGLEFDVEAGENVFRIEIE